MPKRHWWQRVGDAIAAFGHALSEGVDDAAGVPEPSPTPVPVPKSNPQRDGRNAGVTGVDWDNHGPYPKDWAPEQRELWDLEPNTVRDLYDADEWEDLQNAFWFGWFASGLTRAEHDEWRDRFYGISGVTASSFDWEAWRMYMDQYGSPTLSG